MFEEFVGMEMKDLLVLNAKLQKKKNEARKDLAAMGILKKGGVNNYDNYKYFSEAQYKELITNLLSKHGIELTASVLSYDLIEGTEKMAQGRLIKYEMLLQDTETGFYERSVAIGEGFDKGDKAGYKAATGALKYFLANTFLVATGDDPEKESPEVSNNGKAKEVTTDDKKASERQIEILLKIYKGENLEKLLAANNIEKIEDLPLKKASSLIMAYQKKQLEKKEATNDISNQG